MRVLVVGDVGDDDPGFVGERLVAGGARLEPLDRDALPDPAAALHRVDLLLLLGSGRSVADHSQAAPVAAETALITEALAHGIPALGICYGVQILAKARGGSVGPAQHSELGWYTVESADEVLCPPGPWLQFHGDAFTPPAGDRVLGHTSAGPQALAVDTRDRNGRPVRALGWQFHAETTPKTLNHWLLSAADFVQAQGGDAEALAGYAESHQEQARAAAFELTDSACAYLLAG